MRLSAHRDFVRRHGPAAWALRVLERCLARAFRIRVYVAYVLDAPLGVTNADARYSLRELSVNELKTYATDPVWDLTPSFVDGAYARGHRCVAAFDAGRLCGYAWYSVDETMLEQGISVRPAPGFTYSYKHFTHPSVRGKRVQRCLATAAVEARRLAGERGLVTFITMGNFSSRRSVEAIGAREVGWALLSRRGRRRVFARHQHPESACFALRVT